MMLSNDAGPVFAASAKGRAGLFLGKIYQARHELLWVVAGQGLAFIGGFAGIKVLTTTMGPEIYGQLALGMTISGVLNMFVFGPLGQVVSRFFSRYRERKALASYFFLLKKIHLAAISGIVFVAAAATAGVYYYLGTEWAILVAAAALFGGITGVNSSFLSLQSAARQRKVVALHQGADACLRPALAMAMMWLFYKNGYWALTGYFIGTFLVTFSQWFFAMRNPDIREYFWDRPSASENIPAHFKEFLRYSMPFVAFAGFGAASMYSDRWILQAVLGMREVGIYTAVSQIATAPVVLAAGMITQLMVPVIFDKAGDLKLAAQFKASASALKNTAYISMAIMAAICVLLFFFGRPLLLLLTSAEFADNSSLLCLIAAGVSIFNLAQILCIKGNYTNKPHVYFWPKAAQAVIAVALGYAGARSYGLMGVGYALCASSAVYLMMVIRANAGLRFGQIDMNVLPEKYQG